MGQDERNPETLLDIDLMAVTLNKVLFDAPIASAPRKTKSSKKKKKRFFKWNVTVAVSVKCSKDAHADWKRAGPPRDISHSLFTREKVARRQMRQAIRQQFYLETQEKFNNLMRAKETRYQGLL